MTRTLSTNLITSAIRELFLSSAFHLNDKVKERLNKAKTVEPSAQGQVILDTLIKNHQMAQETSTPLCQDTGLAHIYVSGLDQMFSYTGIRALGNRTWRFEGTSLQMSLRSDTTLAVQFTDGGGALRTQVFVALATEPDDLIAQENTRREELFRALYEQGPVFTSNNYGSLALSQDGSFSWTGNRLLVPQVIPASARQGGALTMDLYLSATLRQRYEGAFSMRFDGGAVPVRFMYLFDTQGLRIEYAPETSMDGNLVARRASSPVVIYFYRATL